MDPYLEELAERLDVVDYARGAAERLCVSAELLEGASGATRDGEHWLEVGAYPGLLCVLAREKLGVGRVSALTLASGEEFEQRMGEHGIQVAVCDIETTPFPHEDASVDQVLFCEVLEHLLYPHGVLREIRRVLRPGGRVLVSSPNMAALRNRVRLLLGLSILDPLPDVRWSAEGVPEATYRPHVRTYLLSEALELLGSFSLVPEQVRWAEHRGDRPGLGARVRRWVRQLVTRPIPRLRDTWIVQLRADGDAT